MMALVMTTAVWVGGVAAVLTPVVYGLGNRWWANYWGRSLMFKDVMLALVYARSVIVLVTTGGVARPVTWSTFVITIGLGLALVANLTVMIRVTARSQVTVTRRRDAVPEKDPAT